MIRDMDLFAMAEGLAAHASRRQALIAENVAHADTPGRRAMDLQPFEAVWSARVPDADGFHPFATRPGHLSGDGGLAPPRAEAVESAPRGLQAPNGNDIGLEDQMMRAADAKLQHDLALGVWRSALSILRTSLGRQA